MLRYTIPQRDVREETLVLDIASYNDITSDAYGLDDGDALIQVCLNTWPDTLTTDTDVTLVCDNLLVTYDGETTAVSTVHTVKPHAVDPANKCFSVLLDAYLTLTVNMIEASEEGGQGYLYLYFNETHRYNPDDSCDIYVSYTDDDGEAHRVLLGCDYVGFKTLRWAFSSDDSTAMAFLNALFSNDTYVYSETAFDDAVYVTEIPPTVNVCDPCHIYTESECGTGYDYYERVDGDVNLTLFSFSRPAPCLTGFSASIEIPTLHLLFPARQSFDTMLESESKSDEFLPTYSHDTVVNPVVDMERIPFSPVFPISGTSGTIGGYQPIRHIKFIFHLRERDNQWNVRDDGYWNGVDDSTLNLRDSVTGSLPFFSYNDPSRQSDLMAFFDYENNDIRYRKNRFTRSFLRLLFFDTPNVASQRLLATSTIYYDATDLYGVLTHNGHSEWPYVRTASYPYITANGIATDREPDFTGYITNDDSKDMYRLSSAMTVSGRNATTSSSEGFYIYLFNDGEKGRVPQDLYMRCEYNHAGYGRVLPLMMPYYDDTRDGRRGIKTFDNILDDWRTGIYTIRDYHRYSHIHLRYLKTDNAMGCIYYLDPDTYGTDAFYNMGWNADSSPETLEIALYEAKVAF